MSSMLSGVRILDLTRMLAGPYGALLLADMGAEIIKIEDPKGGDPMRQMAPHFVEGVCAYFLSINRGKKSVALNLRSDEGRALQILSADGKFIIGKNGERLDDLQYLVNRILQKKMEDPPRIRVDCDHFRVRQEEDLEKTARDLAARAKSTGKPMRMRPLNAYHRRIVHNALVDDDEVTTHSPKCDDRMKRIEIRPKR